MRPHSGGTKAGRWRSHGSLPHTTRTPGCCSVYPPPPGWPPRTLSPPPWLQASNSWESGSGRGGCQVYCLPRLRRARCVHSPAGWSASVQPGGRSRSCCCSAVCRSSICCCLVVRCWARRRNSPRCCSGFWRCSRRCAAARRGCLSPGCCLRSPIWSRRRHCRSGSALLQVRRSWRAARVSGVRWCCWRRPRSVGLCSSSRGSGCNLRRPAGGHRATVAMRSVGWPR